MTRPLVLILLAALGVPVLAGCDYEHAESLGPGFGNATQNNMAVQIVNPNPPVAREAPSLDGPLATDAVTRYRNDKVKQPAPTSIGTIGTGGATGGATGGGTGVSTGTQ